MVLFVVIFYKKITTNFSSLLNQVDSVLFILNQVKSFGLMKAVLKNAYLCDNLSNSRINTQAATKGSFMYKRAVQRLARFIIPFLLLATATACQHFQQEAGLVPNEAAKGMTVGALIGGVVAGTTASGTVVPLAVVASGWAGAELGANYEEQLTADDQLSLKGVKFLQKGDKHKIIILTDRFFYPGTPVIRAGAYQVLDGIEQYIAGYAQIAVKVAGYTDNQGDVEMNTSLSRAQAQHIVDYFYQQHIDTRLIYAVGYGGSRPIASNDSEFTRPYNRRLEITFEETHDYL